MSGGDSKYNTYNAKIQESTHIFICDYVSLDKSISAEKSRVVINGKIYDIMIIDNPMELRTDGNLSEIYGRISDERELKDDSIKVKARFE